MLFYQLIQVALGQRDVLSRTPSDEEWCEIFEIVQKQAVAGVAMAALEKLSVQGQKPPQMLLLEWIGLSEQIRQGNVLLTKRCKQLQRQLLELGHKSSVLKGQGVALFYDEPLRDLRQTGDIDIFVGCGLKGAIEIAHRLGVENPRCDYKHLHFDVFEDAEVEMHYRVEVLLNLWKNRRLQKWFKAHTEDVFGHTECTEKTEMVTPTVGFNVFYILLHIYRHFLYEGVGMRQLMDYYFVLKSHTDCTDNKDILHVLKEFGMIRFARGVMWIMQEVFCLERKYMYCEPLESEGRFILGEVMAGGNFGHHDTRLQHGSGKWNTVKQVCKHNWHLMSHYPADVIWAPAWFVWHKCWKSMHRLKGF